MSVGKFEKGDTIIEVLLAIAVFSLVALGSLTLMNKGTTTAQRALEITAVRHQIDNQAELLRYINNAYMSNPLVETDESRVWQQIQTQAGLNTSDIEPISIIDDKCPELSANNPFVLATAPDSVSFNKLTNGNFVNDPPSFAQLRSIPLKAEGLWIEAKSNTSYIDFYIRACWQSIGQKVPMTIQTIVRLYAK